MTTRREFIGAGIAMLGSSRLAAESMLAPASRPLEILFLGGTGFIGPHQINYALDRGHTVTMFNRGRRLVRRPGGRARRQPRQQHR